MMNFCIDIDMKEMRCVGTMENLANLCNLEPTLVITHKSPSLYDHHKTRVITENYSQLAQARR